jgi:Protein of unknown function (DUF3644)
MAKRKRKLWSIRAELLTKSREAMLCAVQVFNNPTIMFKAEAFVVLSNIAWTYLLHSYYRNAGIDYRYFEQRGTKKKFDKTKRGSFKYWELERCLNETANPLDSPTSSNLRFIIGLRHEIEHQMTTRLDDYLSARFQACCLNYNHYIKELFGAEYAIDSYLSFSLQFSSLTDEHAKQLKDFTDLPPNIAGFINEFDNHLSDQDFENPKYSYRVLYVQKAAGTRGKADRVIEFIPADSPEAQGLNREYVLIKDREKPKFLPAKIVSLMKEKGFNKFGMTQHTNLWKAEDGKNPAKGYGVPIASTWYWYESWLKKVEEYCVDHRSELS